MATGPGGTSAPATVSLTVGTPPAPTAGDKSGVAVAYGTATPIDLSGSITGAHTSIAGTAAPGNRNASVSGDLVNYNTAPCYTGAHPFASAPTRQLGRETGRA